MVEIIPSINAETWDEVEKKIRLVEPFVDWVHIDVANGTFAPNVLWHNSLDLVGFKTKCNIEIHLMEDRPEERIEAWLLEPVRRIIVHYEVTHDFPFIIAECRKDKIEIGLSVAPETSWTHLKPFVDDADLLQVLAVERPPLPRNASPPGPISSSPRTIFSTIPVRRWRCGNCK